MTRPKPEPTHSERKRFLAAQYAALDALAAAEKKRSDAYRRLPAETKRVRACQRAIRRRLDRGPATRAELQGSVHSWPDREGRNPREHFTQALDAMRDELAIEVAEDGQTRYTLIPTSLNSRPALPMEGNPPR